MPTLPSELRNKLERVVVEARDTAETGARAALEALAVHHHEPYPHMKPVQRELRNQLRARARQLGDRQDSTARLAIDHLAAECAYEHWHRMLFARFLAENGLLIEPQENMAISLAEAEELAKEDGVDVWVFASRCAQRMLPQIFRPDDPLLQVSFATEHMLKLERLLASLPQAVFIASDALGWVYQFWQNKKKDEVNRSEVKIGADEIAAVTQLFTEPYMVSFLLHNTLGAWWAGKKLSAEDAESAQTEEELRKKLALPGVDWEYLRFVRGADGEGGPWRPAAGTFDGWPESAAEIRVLDPCGGSGHFVVAALHHLVPIRMAEEGLSVSEAVDEVLRENLHGLEIDERCCQIMAFALAFAAWTYPGATGYRPLPDLHIACTGIGPQSTEEQWVKLAEQSSTPTRPDERERTNNGLRNLHRLFSQASTIGSLTNPKQLEGGVFAADYETIQPFLAAILAAEGADNETREHAIAAAGMVRAADLLAAKYTLVITNVPYLGRGRQADTLKKYLENHYSEGKSDLATAFLIRCLQASSQGTSVAVVIPQTWLFLSRYRSLRKSLLSSASWLVVARLGVSCFETISGEVVNVALMVLGSSNALPSHEVASLDCEAATNPQAKANELRSGTYSAIAQKDLLLQPDCIFSTDDPVAPRLEKIALGLGGITTGDSDRFRACFWEVDVKHPAWIPFQGTVDRTVIYGGRTFCLRWDEARGALHAPESGATIAGRDAWSKPGVSLNKMGLLPATIYLGDPFENVGIVISPIRESLLSAVWVFCESGEHGAAVRRIDKSLGVTCNTVVKVPFDLARWQRIAAEKYPDGLPEPESDDPTQWLFHGRPEESTAPLPVAVARLLGYSWPAELDATMRLSKRARALVKRCDELAGFADDDGIVCIPSVRGEEPAGDRLLALLAAAGVKPSEVHELVGETDLDDWLRNRFFEEHCKLFHDRPFVWHVWDGRKRDGFHALVSYHKLCEGGGKGRKLLESLTYSYLGDWIARQKDGVKRGEGGADDRLVAASELQKRLEAILQGEPPFDIFVRWKPLSQQPIGWEPDINDGVRINIRPFLASDLPNGRTGAGVLRWKPNVKWTKDRGKEPARPKADYPWFWSWDEKTEDFAGGKTFDGNRHNDCHYTNKAKHAAKRETGR